jgi:hypothetical protein
MRADTDGNFPVKPFEKIEQFVRGKAATMAVHQVKDIWLGNFPFWRGEEKFQRD